MSLWRLLWRNIRGAAFRSVMIALCAALVSALALAATFVVRGAQERLQANLDRLGADLLVLPWGTMTEKINGVRLMSAAVDGWMPAVTVEQIAALDGVESVSPQLYLGALPGAQGDTFVVALDPEGDFTVRPWRLQPDVPLGVDQALVGALVGGGDAIAPFGYPLAVVDRLEPTGTTIDSTIFVGFETAQAMEAWSQAGDRELFQLMPGAVSAILVRVEPQADPHMVALDLLDQVRGAVPLEPPNLFQAERQQMVGVLGTLAAVLVTIWVLAMVFLALVFSIAVHQRRWEIGVLRALGFSRAFVFRALLLEGAVLALTGGPVGALVTIACVSGLRETLAELLRLPLSLPAGPGLLAVSAAGQALALLSVLAAAVYPAWRISRQEVAFTMRDG